MFDALSSLPISGVEDAEKIKSRYPHRTRIYTKPKDDYLAKGEYTVDFVDDAGQIHIAESGITFIPSIDEISYVCYTCGKTFDYPTTQSRIDEKNVCRRCSASEALDAAGIEDKEAILNMIR